MADKKKEPCATCGGPRDHQTNLDCIAHLKFRVKRSDEALSILEGDLAVVKGTQTIEQRVNFDGSIYDLPGFEPRMSDWDKSRWSEKLLRELSRIHGLIPNREKILERAICLLGFTPGGFPFEKTVNGEDPKDPDVVGVDCPFFTESYLYELLGKEDARTVLSLVGSLLEVAGITSSEQDRIVNATYAKAVAERKRQEDFRRRQEERRQRKLAAHEKAKAAEKA